MFRYVLHDRLETMGMFGQKGCEKYDVCAGKLRSGSRRNAIVQGSGSGSGGMAIPEGIPRPLSPEYLLWTKNPA